MSKKNLVICIVLLFTGLLIQCKKDEVPRNATIIGSWRWLCYYDDYIDGPKTPANTGILETISFYPNNTWKRIQNNVTIDSGSVTLGHGYYLPYQGAGSYTYDSVAFYKNNILKGWDSYEILHNDTLVFSPGWSGRFSSYLEPYNGSRWYVRQ
ncbi:MAG: hypothetical protein Q8861_14430 [Bacteroidota bacterium]|nr:hypothetical protein [Bacteroidota bacterium]